MVTTSESFVHRFFASVEWDPRQRGPSLSQGGAPLSQAPRLTLARLLTHRPETDAFADSVKREGGRILVLHPSRGTAPVPRPTTERR